MTSYELYYRKFERQPQSERPSLTFNPQMEEISETLETAYIEMNPYHSMIEPISTGILEINSIIRMDQTSVNTPTKTPVKSTNIETINNSTNTETLFNSINTGILVNSINPDPFKYPGYHQSHTRKKNVLDVDLTTKV